MDRRLTPANGRVAAAWLKGVVESERFVEGRAARIITPLADLCDEPGGNLDRQLLYGTALRVFEEDSGGGCAFVQAEWDGYVGNVAQTALGPPVGPTHRVTALATHVYPSDSIKTNPVCALSMGSEVVVPNPGEGKMAELASGGFVPRQHLRAADEPLRDWVATAERFLGVPYLWGGNSAWGIDCAGLVQVALRLAGIRFPADSDLQAQSERLIPVEPEAPRQRGDLVFWPGHVAIFRDETTLVHANGHHMAVTSEPFAEVFRRICRDEAVLPTRFGRIAPSRV